MSFFIYLCNSRKTKCQENGNAKRKERRIRVIQKRSRNVNTKKYIDGFYGFDALSFVHNVHSNRIPFLNKMIWKKHSSTTICNPTRYNHSLLHLQDECEIRLFVQHLKQ